MKIGKRAMKVNQMIFRIVSIGRSISLIMELNVLDSGKETIDMDKELRFGQTVRNMKGTGKITKHMEKELLIFTINLYVKVIGNGNLRTENVKFNTMINIMNTSIAIAYLQTSRSHLDNSRILRNRNDQPFTQTLQRGIHKYYYKPMYYISPYINP